MANINPPLSMITLNVNELIQPKAKDCQTMKNKDPTMCCIGNTP